MKTVKSIALELFNEGVTENNLKSRSRSHKKWLDKDNRFDRLKSEITHLWEKKKEKELRENTLTEAKNFGVSVNTLKLVKERGISFLKSLGGTGHSMGFHSELIVLNKKGNKTLTCSIERDMRSYYSRGCKWSEPHGFFSVKITLNDLKKIVYIGGVPTIIKGSGKIKKAKWFTSTGKHSSFKIVEVNGYLTGDYHADTFEKAVQYRKEKARRLALDRLRLRNEEEFLERSKSMFFGINDCRKVMCDPGINAFVNRHNLNKDYGYNLGYLLSFNEETEFLKRLPYLKLK